jgi:chloride channel protein, CIC family
MRRWSRQWDGRTVLHVARMAVLGCVVGVLAGVSSAVFLVTLDWATDTRESHEWLLFLLPAAGLLVGLAYLHLAGSAATGNNLIIDEIHEPRAWIPRRMAPLVYGATVVTQLFGGSAGREGTAIQMSGSLTDATFRRLFPLGAVERRLLLIAAIAGGFGAVFGVPIAGLVFALEVQSIGRMRYDAIVPALAASMVGDRVVHALGVHHTPVPIIGPVDLSLGLAAKAIVAGIACGLVATAFIELTHAIRRGAARLLRWSPWRPFVGGLVVIALTGLAGTTAYLGLSIPLITASLAGGAGVAVMAFAWKLLFTAVTLGSGFQGGEVTPLFVIGATLGATLGWALHAPVPLFAAMGFVAVFAGAANTPIACTVMAVELFGAGPIVPVAMACVLSYVCSSHRGIYTSQRIAVSKGHGAIVGDPRLADWIRPKDAKNPDG